MDFDKIVAAVKALVKMLQDWLAQLPAPTPPPEPVPTPPPTGQPPVYEVKVFDAAGNSLLSNEVTMKGSWRERPDKNWYLDLTFRDGRSQPLSSEFQAVGWEVTFPMSQPGIAPVTRLITGNLAYKDGRVKFTVNGEKVSYIDTPKLGVSLRYGWQQFPKAFRVTPDAVTVLLHPREWSESVDEPDPPAPAAPIYRRNKTFYFNATGGAKTYQLLVRTQPGDMASLDADFQSPRQPIHTDPKVQAVMARYGIVPAGAHSKGYDDWHRNNVYTPSVNTDTGSGAYPLGWRDLGNRMRLGHATINGKQIPTFYNDTHVGGGQQFFLQYLRTGETIWWHLGEIATRNFMDFGVCHANREVNGIRKNLGPGEPNLGGHDNIDHEGEGNKLHDGHWHLSGLPIYVQLTGDARATEVLKEVGEWLLKFIPTRYEVPFVHNPPTKPHFAEAERDFGWCLYACNELYRTFGDTRYLDAAAKIVQHLIGWWQFPSDHIVNGAKVGENRWQQGTGWWFMYPKQGNGNNNGCNPWMATACMSNVITFLALDPDNRVDHELAYEMLRQVMGYVIKFGYDATNKKFFYAEGSTNYDTGTTHYYYPLAILGKKFGVAQWTDIAKTWYLNQAKPRTNSSVAGWYGYETVFPVETWKELANA